MRKLVSQIRSKLYEVRVFIDDGMVDSATVVLDEAIRKVNRLSNQIELQRDRDRSKREGE